MTKLRTALCAAAILAGAVGVAVAMPPPPVSLEKRIAESDLIVVGKLKSQPVHCGDVYDVDVEETLKGAAPAAIRVRSPYYFNGDEVVPNQPQPKSREAGARRAIFFCGVEKDGARDTSNVVTLDPDDGMSATFWIGIFARYRASFGPEAVKQLVALDDERAGAERAVTLWIQGLRSENPILVEALLDRYRIVSGADSANSENARRFGDAVVRRAARDAAASPKELLVAVLAHTGAKLPPHRATALCRAAEAFVRATADDRPLFDAAIDSARTSRKAAAADVRDAAMWLLVVAETDEAVPALTDALTRPDAAPFSIHWSIELATGLAKKSAARKDEVVDLFVSALDAGEDRRPQVIDALKKLTGQTFSDAASWKTWWAARKK